jgi:ABC-type phosphate/phosphonate transport system permease subunit
MNTEKKEISNNKKIIISIISLIFFEYLIDSIFDFIADILELSYIFYYLKYYLTITGFVYIFFYLNNTVSIKKEKIWDQIKECLYVLYDILYKHLQKTISSEKFKHFLLFYKNMKIFTIIGVILGIILGISMSYFFMPNLVTKEVDFLDWIAGIFTGIQYKILFHMPTGFDPLGIGKQIKTTLALFMIAGGVLGGYIGYKKSK